MVMHCHTQPQRKRTHRFAYKNHPVCLLFLFLCRVRTEKKSSRERRGRTGRPKRKCAAAAAAIIWCQAFSPAVPPAHCAARPCRKRMACSAWVSNTTATVLTCTRACSQPDTHVHRCCTHIQTRIYLCYCTRAHLPTYWSAQAHRQTTIYTHTHTH